MKPTFSYENLSQVAHRICGHQSICKRKTLVQKILDNHKNDAILLSSPGIENILVFKNKANDVLIQNDEDDNDDDNKAIPAP